MFQSTKMKREWRSENYFDIRHEDAEFGVCPAGFLSYFGGLLISDWMDLRRDFEIWNFNIVETAMDYGDFGSWTKCIFIMLWLGIAPINSCV